MYIIDIGQEFSCNPALKGYVLAANFLENPPSEIRAKNVRAERLVRWVMARVNDWEEHRNTNFDEKWKEYYSQWKGIYLESSRIRQSERSKFISPALQQAIEMAVAEQEEATFGKDKWFDLEDDIKDKQQAQIAAQQQQPNINQVDQELVRDQLLEDFSSAGIPGIVSETYLNGAIYGQGIGKINVGTRIEQIVEGGEIREIERFEVTLQAVSPEDFVIDPSALGQNAINEALGCAHIMVVPKYTIVEKQRDGTYNDGEIGSFTDGSDVHSKGEVRSKMSKDKAKIIEYHGKVPRFLLSEFDLFDENGDEVDEDEFDLVESIITIANENFLLRDVRNPLLFKDRAFIAYQHDTVPNRFWGRGVAEKGINSQRALNAELRARQDGLALTIHPMMAMDSSALPRGQKLEVAPGKTILTTGDPRNILHPLHFGEMSSHTYSEAAELERMLQMATGAMDSATSINANARNATASGMSMIQANSIKRSKRSMQNIERNFINPLIQKAIWRYMQFDPDRYPYSDYKFISRSSMGIMAREFEQSQLTNMLSLVPRESPIFGQLLSDIYDNTSLTGKEGMKSAIAQTFAPRQPTPEEEQIKQIAIAKEIKELELLNSKIENTAADTAATLEKIDIDAAQTQVNAFNAIAQVEDKELDRLKSKQNG